MPNWSKYWWLRQGFKGIPFFNCAAKLLLLSLKTKSIVHSHQFPASVVPRFGSFLNDIAINLAGDEGTQTEGAFQDSLTRRGAVRFFDENIALVEARCVF